MKHSKKLRIEGQELIHEDMRQHCLHSEITDWNSPGIDQDFLGAELSEKYVH